MDVLWKENTPLRQDRKDIFLALPSESNQLLVNLMDRDLAFAAYQVPKVPVVWTPDAKRQLIGKDPDAGKDWRQEEKRTTEDEMVGWHHWLKGHESEEAPEDGEGQGRLVCCSPWGRKESDTTEWLNNNLMVTVFDIIVYIFLFCISLNCLLCI